MPGRAARNMGVVLCVRKQVWKLVFVRASGIEVIVFLFATFVFFRTKII